MSGYDMEGFFDLKPPSDPYAEPSRPSAPVNPSVPSNPSQEESCFYIAAKECHLVLDIEGGNLTPMTKVILWEQKEPSEASNQLWFNHLPTGTIRSRADANLVLEVIDNLLHVNTQQQGNTNQLWEGSDQFIRNRMNPTLVFQIAGTDYGSSVVAAQSNFLSSQHFEPIFVDIPPSLPSHPSNPCSPQPNPQPNPQPTPQLPPFSDSDDGDSRPSPRLFFLVCEMHGKVMDVRGANPDEGAEVVAYHKQSNGPLNQLWYWDQQGILTSALNHFVPTASGKATQLRMYKKSGGTAQMFKRDGDKITNGAGECVDVRGGRRWDGTQIITYSYKGDSNQHWREDYI